MSKRGPYSTRNAALRARILRVLARGRYSVAEAVQRFGVSSQLIEYWCRIAGIHPRRARRGPKPSAKGAIHGKAHKTTHAKNQAKRAGSGGARQSRA